MDYPTSVSIPVDALRKMVADIFAAAGCGGDEAGRVARYLVSANLAGHDSHGVIRVPRYVEQLGDGRVRAGQTITVVKETATHATVDGNLGLGQTIAPLAVDLGIAKARAAGVAVIALRNSGHIGRVGDWGERAAEAGLVSIHFVNARGSVLVAPFGAAESRFGTNPVVICVPVADGPPLLLDFATSLVAEGKVLVASNGGKKLPANALVAPDGSPSSDPAMLYGPLGNSSMRVAGKGPGAIRAFGDHKGSGLAFMCEILAGLFGGADTSGPLDGSRRGFSNGMLSIYIDPASLGTEGYVRQVAEYVAWVKAARPAEAGGEVLVPGEPEQRNRATRLRDGVPLQPDTWANLKTVAAELKVSVPEV